MEYGGIVIILIVKLSEYQPWEFRSPVFIYGSYRGSKVDFYTIRKILPGPAQKLRSQHFYRAGQGELVQVIFAPAL